jgi:hypothetical protein
MSNNELWEEIYLKKNANELYKLFINKLSYYFYESTSTETNNRER